MKSTEQYDCKLFFRLNGQMELNVQISRQFTPNASIFA